MIFVTLPAMALAMAAETPKRYVHVDRAPGYAECVDRETEAAKNRKLKGTWKDFNVRSTARQVMAACQPIWSDYREEVRKRYPDGAADRSLSDDRDQMASRVDRELEYTMNAMRISAARKQACIEQGNAASACEWREKFIAAKRRHEKCLDRAMFAAAADDVAVDDAFAFIQKACAEHWGKMVESSRELGIAAGLKEDYLDQLRAYLLTNYPKVREQVRDRRRDG